MVNAPDLSLRGPNGAVAISGRHLQFVQSNDKTYQPIASVAAVTAQPLAALPPYGCGVPFTGSDRLAGWQCLQRKFIGAMPSSLSLRGGRRPTWQSRSTRPDHRKAIGENATAFPRLPRRFAPRNDTSGGYCGAPAPSSGLIPLCKALNERRYRRNRSVRFYRHLVRTGSAFPRLPRRFAPRNDTSGRRSNGNGAAHRIGGTTAASRTGGACPAPTGPVRI